MILKAVLVSLATQHLPGAGPGHPRATAAFSNHTLLVTVGNFVHVCFFSPFSLHTTFSFRPAFVFFP